MMRIQKINFSDRQSICVFPDKHSELTQAVSELQLQGGFPVIVLIGGGIEEEQAAITQRAIQTISRIAEDIHAVVVCGGTDMGVMAEVGRVRCQNFYKFPLVGIAPEALVAWPGGPQSSKFLWWGRQRWQLASHYSHFILVPGSQFGDESPWIVDAATILSQGHRSVTVLINGGEISRKDIELSLEHARQVVALSHTGRLADELARQSKRHKLITVLPANADQRITEVIQAALLVNEKKRMPQLVSVD
jgi:hypothetical protein